MKNGKAICKTLKEIRLQVALANGIDYRPAKCDNENECSGTCPQCDREVRYLEHQLTLHRRLGKAIQLAGLGVSLAALTACHTTKKYEMLAGVVDRPAEHIKIDTLSVEEPDTTALPPAPKKSDDLLPPQP
ncbi:MAG: hypothetical protein IJ928_10685 [Prevotella sp.]|nr:hypothetical protein [Prevotella sp.]